MPRSEFITTAEVNPNTLEKNINGKELLTIISDIKKEHNLNPILPITNNTGEYTNELFNKIIELYFDKTKRKDKTQIINFSFPNFLGRVEFHIANKTNISIYCSVFGTRWYFFEIYLKENNWEKYDSTYWEYLFSSRNIALKDCIFKALSIFEFLNFMEEGKGSEEIKKYYKERLSILNRLDYFILAKYNLSFNPYKFIDSIEGSSRIFKTEIYLPTTDRVYFSVLKEAGIAKVVFSDPHFHLLKIPTQIEQYFNLKGNYIDYEYNFYNSDENEENITVDRAEIPKSIFNSTPFFKLNYNICGKCNQYYKNDKLIESEENKNILLCFPCSGFNPQLVQILGYSTNPFDIIKCEIPNEFKNIVTGLELEFNALQDTSRIRMEIAKNLKNYLIFKSDGSLNTYGFEMVTIPDIIPNHLNKWKIFYDKNLNKDLISEDRTGMHVHVSRKSATKLTLGRIIDFINYKDNKKFIDEIAERENCRHAKLDPTLSWGIALNPDEQQDRYVSINLKKGNTFEFRIFKTPKTYLSLAKNLEFIKSLMDFFRAGWCQWNPKEARELSKYMNYLKDTNKSKQPERCAYPMLNQFLIEKGWWS